MRQPTFYIERAGGKYKSWPIGLDINSIDLNYPFIVNYIIIPVPDSASIEVHAILWSDDFGIHSGRWDVRNGWTLRLSEDRELAPELGKIQSDGSTAAYYELPRKATELQDLISYKDMNAQIGEIFRAAYRYGEVEHSEKMRDIKKIRFYAEAEISRLQELEDKESAASFPF